jgi:hypothetical protein
LKISEVELSTADQIELILKNLEDDEVVTSSEICKKYNKNQGTVFCALEKHKDQMDDIVTYKIGRTTYYGKKNGIKKLRDRFEGRRG